MVNRIVAKMSIHAIKMSNRAIEGGNNAPYP
jgi:hypothetical protein